MNEDRIQLRLPDGEQALMIMRAKTRAAAEARADMLAEVLAVVDEERRVLTDSSKLTPEYKSGGMMTIERIAFRLAALSPTDEP